MRVIKNLFYGLGSFGIILYVCLWLAGVYGYFVNIINIINHISGPFTTELFVRCVGVIAFPLGAIMGFVN